MDIRKTILFDAYMGYLEALAKSMREEGGDEIVAELRTKILFQMEIREQELGRPLTDHEQSDVFWLAMSRFHRSRQLARALYRKSRSS